MLYQRGPGALAPRARPKISDEGLEVDVIPRAVELLLDGVLVELQTHVGGTYPLGEHHVPDGQELLPAVARPDARRLGQVRRRRRRCRDLDFGDEEPDRVALARRLVPLRLLEDLDPVSGVGARGERLRAPLPPAPYGCELHERGVE